MKLESELFVQNATQQEFINTVFKRNTTCFRGFPDKQIAEDFIDELFFFLFGTHERKLGEEKLVEQFEGLKSTFSALLFELIKNEEKVKQHTRSLFDAIPQIYKKLLLDAEAILKFDPAAQSLEEVLVAYPGFYATAIYRIAHQLHEQGIKTLPRILSEYAHSKTGIDIHPGAEIGESFFIDHGTGGGSGRNSDNREQRKGVPGRDTWRSERCKKCSQHQKTSDN